MNLLVPQRAVDVVGVILVLLLASYWIESKVRLAGTGSIGGNAIALYDVSLPPQNSES